MDEDDANAMSTYVNTLMKGEKQKKRSGEFDMATQELRSYIKL